MLELITGIGEIVQDFEVARTCVYGLRGDINQSNHINAINNYKKLSAALSELNKKMSKFKRIMDQLEDINKQRV